MCADGVEVEKGKPVWYFDTKKGYIERCGCDSDNLYVIGTYSEFYSTREACESARDAYFKMKKGNTEKPTMDQLISLVWMWGYEKGIIHSDCAIKQLGKMTEELGEVAGAFLKGDKDGLRLEIGDLLVTIILFATQNGFDINECLVAAYDKIKNRQGKTVDGVFVKSEDL